jgi:DNA polymerase III alpha subunit
MEREIDRWGRVLFHSDSAIELLFQGHDITKLHITASLEIDDYNAVCVDQDKLAHVINPIVVPALTPEDDAVVRQQTWWMPDDYQNLDVHRKLLNLCQDQTEIDRVNLEMTLFEDRGLLPVLRLMCFLVDHWRANKVLWGVGRGSSVASYCLFLIGIHRVNSLHYDLDITEFLK